MPLRDRLYMLPVERYEKYGKYPWRLIIDVLLLVFTTAQLLLIVTPNNLYAQNQLNLWNKLLVPEKPLLTDITGLKTLLRKTITSLKNINYESFDYYTLPDSFQLHMYGPEVKLINITADDLGVLETNPKDFLRSITHFYLQVQVKHELTNSRCFNWELLQRFTFEHSGPILVSMNSDYKACPGQIWDLAQSYIWLHIIVLVLAVTAVIMTLRSFFTRIDIVAEIRGDNPGKMWGRLEFTEKLRFFPLWLIATTIGNLAQFFGSILAFTDVNMMHTSHAGLIGLGCFCTWISIIRYFEGASELYTLVNTVKRAGRILLLFYTGVAPVFLGYVFLGMSFLTGTGYFNTVPSTIAALYAVMCGDTIYDIFMSSMKNAGFFGGLYVISFIIFFIACVHNIFIAIIQEAFLSLAKRPPRRLDESGSEDEMLQSKEVTAVRKAEGSNLARLEMKKKSRRTFKRLMTHEAPLLSQDEDQRNTEDALRRLTRLKEETAILIRAIESAGNPSESVDHTAVEERLKEVKAELGRMLGT